MSWQRSADFMDGFNFWLSDACSCIHLFCVCVFVSAFNLDNEQPDYDMDSEDETLLNRLNRKMEIKPLQFEIMIDRLEKASSSQVSCCAKKWLSYFSFLVGWFCLYFFFWLV